MTVIPLIFVLVPMIQMFTADTAALRQADFLGIMLAIPALVPTVVAAHAVVGEREQGTLEPLLTTPVRREEFVLGKALVALVSSLVVSYAVYAVVIAVIGLFTRAGVAAAVIAVGAVHPATGLVLLNSGGWRVTSRLLDRERLITGTR